MRSKRVQDRKECIGWMPGHWEGRTLSEAKGHGEIPSVIHGSPIGKPYPSSVASLRSLDFSNLANWNIWVAKGREINRDPVSSGERERIGEEKQRRLVRASAKCSLLFRQVSFDLLWIGWWKNQQATAWKLTLLLWKGERAFFLFIDVEVESGGGELEERNEPR